jgi:hypothetical protein
MPTGALARRSDGPPSRSRKPGSGRSESPFWFPPQNSWSECYSLLRARGPVLAGFDFPIGVPFAYGVQTSEPDFVTALTKFGTGHWERFYEVAEHPSEISIERPFYPRRSSSEAKQAHLIQALCMSSINDLRRRCERMAPQRRAACPLFWTLGGHQVGKAAIAGWREVVGPAHRKGAKLWPFDGMLSDLARGGGLTVAETYPAEAYGHVGVRFAGGESKRRQEDRASKAGAIMAWSAQAGVQLARAMESAVGNGFGKDASGENRFDAALGLLGMVEVVTGRRLEGGSDPDVRTWEGWILGQAA